MAFQFLKLHADTNLLSGLLAPSPIAGESYVYTDLPQH